MRIDPQALQDKAASVVQSCRGMQQLRIADRYVARVIHVLADRVPQDELHQVMGRLNETFQAKFDALTFGLLEV